MKKVVSVLFDKNNKKYYFGSIDGLEINDKVVVETQRGLELARVVEKEKEIEDSEVVGELKYVLRKANENDILSHEKNVKESPYLFDRAKKIIKKSGLDMKLIEVSYVLDRSKVVVYYTSDGRVDFRELVKELVNEFHNRIEMRQVGPRDASRVISGIGVCGNQTCCSRFLGDIQNVSIKMAKKQNLSLNPSQISGLCGKLLCCLAYEEDQYKEIENNNSNNENENNEEN